MELTEGWDSAATLVGGRWIERRPRHPAAADRLRMETRVMPWLAPRLPLAVPRPHLLRAAPLVVRHALVPGAPTERPTAAHARQLGTFLRVLHATDAAAAVDRGLPDAPATVLDRTETVCRFRAAVLPLLPADLRDPARELLAGVAECPADTVVHGDLGPEHVLADDSGLTGVIDFSDAHVGDPAIDLAWALFGTPAEFAAALADAYAVSPGLRERALLWHRLGPWYEVLHGVENDRPADVRSGLDGVMRRLDVPERP
ncbi:aminoglycoside phosphotransferase [Marinitenerispora sediminis]|uniref:Aminoglycoside phosphotransferase n=1 Tax=Marinitenerispora sediminis TaxID=1931232 RepID=A0A368SYL9_9ACTN|nr:aminoglycoside phosphotransferase [Marinitenerispora sediminis]RCV47863.1 aminoglycoside phosphotransferase [Marinitenerispora sediminis]RCV49288.1 aminoglycoside phosphotransferase [Marinitenerispora sediminis]